MKNILLSTIFFLIINTIYSQIYLNEIMVTPPGTDSPREFIELRGTPNATIPNGTYIVKIEGDEESGEPGDVESDLIDLSGLSFGSNGFLVLLTTGHPYAGILDPDANVVLDLTDGNLEDKSHTFLLINTDTPPSSSDDIDSNNDGEPDGTVYNNWTILDGISMLDDDYGIGEFEHAYSDVVFVEQITIDENAVKVPSTATIVGTGTSDYDYFSRVGNSTGSTLANDGTSDWMGGDLSSVNDLTTENWETSNSTSNNYPDAYTDHVVDHLGSPNPIPASLVIPGDDACNAITINVNDTSTGDQYTNDGATVQIREPDINFNDGINNSVWFSFTAPTNGNVKITTDIAGGTLTNTEMAVYEVSDCSDFSTYNRLGFNQDGGNTVVQNSILNLYDLVAGNTYYIQVDGFDVSSRGTFGLEVQDLTLSQIYLNEIMVTPPGSDSPREFIELRGTPNATIPNGTYIVQIEGDEESGEPGDVESDLIDLSGLSFGSNGFLVLLTTGHPYAGILDPDANVVLDLTDGNLEDKSHTFLLINTDTAPTSSDDIDSDNDGEPDGAVYNNWTILDGISMLDDDYGTGEFEHAYSDVVFVEQITIDDNAVKAPSTATIVGTGTSDYDYFSRVGNSTGSTLANDGTSDWMGGDLSSVTDLTIENWETSNNTSNNYPDAYTDHVVDHLGSPNPIPASLVIPGDDACNAITINVNDTSTGDQYTNDGATVQIGEPDINFNDGINNSVWFSFTAPTYGNVQITTDISGGTLDNTEIAVYEVKSCEDFSSYKQIKFDQDSGETLSNNSVINLYDLTEAETYYVQVDGFFESNVGTFGLEIRDLTYTYDESNAFQPSDPSGQVLSAYVLIVESGTAVISSATTLKNVQVNSESVLDLDANLTADIIFKSDADGSGQLDDATGVTITGDATVERFIPAGDNNRRAFRFLTSAVDSNRSIKDNWQEGANNTGINYPTDNRNPNPDFGTHISGSQIGANGFDATPTGNPSMFTFDNTFLADQSGETQADAWSAIPNTDTKKLTAGEPYLTFIRGDRSINVTSNSATPTNTTLRATGNLYVGDFSPTLSNKDGFYSLIGNPYQAIVDFNQLNFNGDVNNNNMYIWNPNANTRGAYETIITAADQMIQPGQSFFVQNSITVSTTPEITFTESAKNPDGTLTDVFNDTQTPNANLELYNSNNLKLDNVQFKFDENANNGIDDFDAGKLFNPDENLAVVNTNTLLSVETRDIPMENVTLPLYIDQFQFENYEFRIGLHNWDENIDVYIVDNYLNNQSLILPGQNYSFSVDDNIPESMAYDRFSIIFDNTTLGLNDISLSNHIKIFPNPSQNGDFNIITEEIFSDRVNVKIFNLLGMEVYNENLSQNSNGVISVENLNLNGGIYIVEVKDSSQRYQAKLIVK